MQRRKGERKDSPRRQLLHRLLHGSGGRWARNDCQRLGRRCRRRGRRNRRGRLCWSPRCWIACGRGRGGGARRSGSGSDTGDGSGSDTAWCLFGCEPGLAFRKRACPRRTENDGVDQRRNFDNPNHDSTLSTRGRVCRWAQRPELSASRCESPSRRRSWALLQLHECSALGFDLVPS